MAFDHERLDVYQLALVFPVLADDTIERLPRGRSHLADQLVRAALESASLDAAGLDRGPHPALVCRWRIGCSKTKVAVKS